MRWPTTWILVADSAGTRILRNSGGGPAVRRLTDTGDCHGADGARRMAGRLDSLSAEEQFDRLIIVAPPPTLSLLRHSLSPAIRAQVYGELGRDVTGCPDAAVETIVRDTFVGFAP